MHILLTADGRSPITKRWIQGLLALQHRVSLVSTFPCQPPAGVTDFHVLPVAFSSLGGSQALNRSNAPAAQPASRSRGAVSRFRDALQIARYWLGPLSLHFYGQRFNRIVKQLQPDIVHALRIPFEGMLAAYTPAGIPLAISIWGNDLTLHANGSPLMRERTEQVIRKAQGLMADANRDIRLARQWGYPADFPWLVVPGSGGIDLVEVTRAASHGSILEQFDIPVGVPLVINPRGFRPGSVRNDVFFASLPLALERCPEAVFLCPAMANQTEALQWVERYHLQKNVFLLPYLSQVELWSLFRQAQASISISVHDGTPNSLLESMACGCFPIVGDIESLREWITPGVNGWLVPPDNPQALAEALNVVLHNPALRQSAAEINQKIIHDRAELNLMRSQIQVFYQRLAPSA
ncbi:MAG: glycosyltransferase [Chloroflexi bacterium]|nr:glycosyltransferase [Chloroflexota bacterium]